VSFGKNLFAKLKTAKVSHVGAGTYIETGAVAYMEAKAPAPKVLRVRLRWLTIYRGSK